MMVPNCVQTKLFGCYVVFRAEIPYNIGYLQEIRIALLQFPSLSSRAVKAFVCRFSFSELFAAANLTLLLCAEARSAYLFVFS